MQESDVSVTCPKCGYVRQPYDTAPDYECPKCGVVYAKARAKQAGHSNAEAAKAAQEEKSAIEAEARRKDEARRLHDENVRRTIAASPIAACADCGGMVSKLAVSCPHCGRPFGDTRQPVVVMDVHMGFESMVTFMVKWVLASIPAFLLLVLIFAAVSAAIPAILGIWRT